MKKLFNALLIIAIVIVGLYIIFGSITRTEENIYGACDISGYEVVDLNGNPINL